MAKLLATGLLLLAATLCHAQVKEDTEQEERTYRMYLAPTIGVGLSGREKEMKGMPFMGMFSVPFEFKHSLYIIPEMYALSFRSAVYPDQMRGLFGKFYARLGHNAYGIRIGKGFKSIDPMVTFRASVGVNLLLIDEPCCVRGQKFGTAVEYNLYRTYAIPMQVDMRFRLRPEGRTFLVVGTRWNPNGRRPFGSLNAGLEAGYIPVVHRKHGKSYRPPR